MKKKLNDLQCEIRKIQDGVDDYTREYLKKKKKIIEEILLLTLLRLLIYL